MKCEEYVTPKADPVYARYKFHNKVQGQDEPAEQFVTELKLLAKDCSFKDPEEMIRDRIVFGTNSSRVREKLTSVGEVVNSEFSEISETSENIFPRFSPPSFPFCTIPKTENSEENLGDFL